MPRPQRRLQTEACQNAGVVRVNKADAPTAIGPEAYASWRATPLGAITEGIEQCLILDLMGDLAGRRVLDAGCGDGALICAAASRGAAATGIDPDPAMLAAARSRVGGRLVVQSLCRVGSNSCPSARPVSIWLQRLRSFALCPMQEARFARWRACFDPVGVSCSGNSGAGAGGQRSVACAVGSAHQPGRQRGSEPGPSSSPWSGRQNFLSRQLAAACITTGWHACPRPATSRFRARPADNVRCGVHRGERRTGRWSLGERMLVTVGPRVSTIRLPRA